VRAVHPARRADRGGRCAADRAGRGLDRAQGRPRDQVLGARASGAGRPRAAAQRGPEQTPDGPAPPYAVTAATAQALTTPPGWPARTLELPDHALLPPYSRGQV
jgi:hypothetical protein